MLKISRKRLIKIAFKALENVPDVSVEDRRHMLYAACTMPEVALGTWIVDNQCGCLVGTMLLNKQDPDVQQALISDDRTFNGLPRYQPPSGPLHRVGCEFDLMLIEFMEQKYGEGGFHERRLAQEKKDRRLYNVIRVKD